MINLKLVHLLLDPNYPADIPQDKWASIMKKQNDSIESIGKIKSYFKSYTQQFSKINRTELPKESCAVPEMVQEKLNDNINDVAISYGHYGAFKAHERAVKNEFSDDVDGIIVFEGDVILDVEPEEFINSIIKSYKFGLRNDASFITFGELKLGIRAEDPWKEIKDLGDFIEVPHFLCCHSYLINPRSIPKILKLLDKVIDQSRAIDHSFILIQPKLNCFSFTPGMTNQLTNESDTDGGLRDQTHFLKILGQHYYINNLSEFDYDEYFKN